MSHEAWQEQPDSIVQEPEQLNLLDATRIALMQNAAGIAGYFLRPDAASTHLADLTWYLGKLGIEFDEAEALVNTVSLTGYDPSAEDVDQVGSFISRLAEAMAERAPRDSIAIRTIGQTALLDRPEAPATFATQRTDAPPETPTRDQEPQQEWPGGVRPNVLLRIEDNLERPIVAKLEAYAEFAHRMDFTSTNSASNFNPARIRAFTEKLAEAGIECNGYKFTDRDMLLIIAEKYRKDIGGFPDSYDDGEYPEGLQSSARSVELLLEYLRTPSVRGSIKKLASDYNVELYVVTTKLPLLAETFKKIVRKYEAIAGMTAFEVIAPGESLASDTETQPEDDSEEHESPIRNLSVFPDVYDPDSDPWSRWSEVLEHGLQIGDINKLITDSAGAAGATDQSSILAEISDAELSGWAIQLPEFELPQYDMRRIGFTPGNYAVLHNTSFPPVANIEDNPLDDLAARLAVLHETAAAQTPANIQPALSAELPDDDYDLSGKLPDMALVAQALRRVRSVPSSSVNKATLKTVEISMPELRSEIAAELRRYTDQADRSISLSPSDIAIVQSLAKIQVAQERLPEPPSFVANVRHLISDLGIVDAGNTPHYIPDYETAKRALYKTLFSIAMVSRNTLHADTDQEAVDASPLRQLLQSVYFWANGSSDELITGIDSPEKAHQRVIEIYTGVVHTIKSAPPRVRGEILEHLRKQRQP